MSLDFSFVKCRLLPTCLAELEEDVTFEKSHYTALAERLFPTIQWQGDGSGLYFQAGIALELRPSNASLSLSASGEGDVFAQIEAAALVALESNVVTIDIQSSELFAPVGCEHVARYAHWYKTVVYGASG